MSATNHTSNFRLNQWEGTDPILRTDFNADNLIIENALSQRSSVKLVDTSLTAAQSSLSVNLADFDLSKYTLLRIIALPVHAESEVGSALRINSLSSGYKGCSAGFSSVYASDRLCSIIGASNNASYPSWGGAEISIFLASSAILCRCEQVYADASEIQSAITFGLIPPSVLTPTGIRTLDFLPSAGNMQTGSRIIVYGMV